MARRQQDADRVIRPKPRSPGHPEFQRHVEAAFWVESGKVLVPTEAAEYVDWFNHRRLHGEIGVASPAELEALHGATVRSSHYPEARIPLGAGSD